MLLWRSRYTQCVLNISHSTRSHLSLYVHSLCPSSLICVMKSNRIVMSMIKRRQKKKQQHQRPKPNRSPINRPVNHGNYLNNAITKKTKQTIDTNPTNKPMCQTVVQGKEIKKRLLCLFEQNRCEIYGMILSKKIKRRRKTLVDDMRKNKKGRVNRGLEDQTCQRHRAT